MFKNLKAEMTRHDVSTAELASTVGISAKTLYLKLSGKSEFTYSQIVAISKYLGDMSIDYLFARENKTA